MTQTITQKRKLSKGAWAFILLIIIALGTVIILSAVGIIDPSPIVNGFMYVFAWASQAPVNAVLLFSGIFAGGLLLMYVVYTYFRGQKVTTIQQPGYSPMPTYPTAPVQKDTETKIS